MGVLYLVRHGQAPAHAYAADDGRDDALGLTDLGFEQARRTGQALAAQVPAFTAAVSGDLSRQRATLGDAPAPTVDTGWDEYSVGSLPAAPTPDLLEEKAGYQDLLDASLARWIAGASTGAPDAETYRDYRARTTAAADRVRDLCGSGQTVLVASSAGTITALLARLWGVPDERWPQMARAMVNASITKLIVGRRGFTPVSFNEHGHLSGQGGGLVTFR
ncbi:MAG: histidine phosphatase family protein [Gordonia sp. (in: high G+C Gram-positive bacteria)]|uniref:histidine phosphatase family protein n=1 Tax=Gordonia sp. (in: high G+C Gram-positive bacteria) TaxID=84139 RepID=UPI0039E3D88F